MPIAHQPGSEPVEIPEQIPNPAVWPTTPANPDTRPERKEPVKVPDKVPAGRLMSGTRCSVADNGGGENLEFSIGLEPVVACARSEVWGQTAATAVAKDDALLVADDTAKAIWRVAYTGKPKAGQ